MVINQQNLDSLYRGYSTAFNKAFNDAETNYSKIAMTVPSSTREGTNASTVSIIGMKNNITFHILHSTIKKNIIFNKSCDNIFFFQISVCKIKQP